MLRHPPLCFSPCAPRVSRRPAATERRTSVLKPPRHPASGARAHNSCTLARPGPPEVPKPADCRRGAAPKSRTAARTCRRGGCRVASAPSGFQDQRRASTTAFERGRGAHDLLDELRVRAVVPADLGVVALDGVELGDDRLLSRGQLLGDRGEDLGEVGIGRLLRQLLRPVQGEVEVAAAVVDRAEGAPGRLVVLEERAGRGVEGLREHAGALVARGVARCSSEAARAKNSPSESQRR